MDSALCHKGVGSDDAIFKKKVFHTLPVNIEGSSWRV